MDYYRTKGDLLEAQGKDRADTRWVDRQIAKGLISRDEDGFYFVMDYLKERVEELESQGGGVSNYELEEKVGILKRQLEKAEEENTELRLKLKEAEEAVKDSGGSIDLNELEEAKIQWEYYEKVAKQRAAMMEKVIHETYVIAKSKLGNKMEEESDFRSSILQRVRESE